MNVSLENHTLALWDYYVNLKNSQKHEFYLTLNELLKIYEHDGCACRSIWKLNYKIDDCTPYCIRTVSLGNTLGLVREGSMFRISYTMQLSRYDVYLAYNKINDLINSNQALALTSNLYWLKIWLQHDHSKPLSIKLEAC